MARELDYNREIMYQLNQIRYEWRMNPVLLGGSSGSGGGSGGAPGGVIGYLPQKNVAGDTTESFLFSSGSPSNLVYNLNNIRAWLLPNHSFWADVTSPETTVVHITSGSWYYEDGKPPLAYLGSDSPALSAPSSGSRYDLLTINDSGTLAWSSSAEGNPPDYPTSFPSAISKQMPLWMVLSRSSGSCIKRYDDGTNHYIFRDERPFLGAPTYMPSSGSAYIDYQWYKGGALAGVADLEGVYYLADDFVLKGSYGYVATAPSSGSVIVDIEYSTDNGSSWTSVYSSTKLVILSGESFSTRVPDAIMLSAGTLIRAAIDDPGSGASSLSVNLYGTIRSASGGGTVTNVSATGAQGVTTSVTNPSTTPSITIGLGAITPTSVAATGTVTGSNLSGSNTGDQTITLTGDVTGSGTSTIAATISDTGVVADSYSNANITVGTDGRILAASSGSGSPISPTLPEDIATTASQGASDYAAAGDHRHRGLHSLSVPGGSFIYGDAVLVPYAGVEITQSSGSLLLSASTGSGALYPDPASDVADTAGAGISGLSSRGDHVHRGVTFVAVSSPIYGEVTLAEGTNIGLSQFGNTVTISATTSGTGFGATGGRLTLVTHDPIGEDGSSGSVYYMPYLTNAIELYDGAAWGFISFDETSIDLSGYSADTNYDVFAYNNSGTLALETWPWDNDRAYNTNVEYNYTDGRWTGKLTLIEDPTRLYLGTFRVDSSELCHDSETQRWLWNFFNQVDKSVRVSSTSGHAYTTAAWRDWNNDDTLNVGVLVGYPVSYKHPLALIADMNGGDDSGPVPASASIAVYRSRLDDWADQIIATNASIYQMRYAVTDTEHPDADGNYAGYAIYQLREYGGTGCYFNSAVLSGVVRM